MIQKVKPPAKLKLIHSSNATKNNLGGQSGEAYSQNGPQNPDSQSQKNDASALIPIEEETHKNLEQAPVEEQVGLTNVVKEWLEKPKDSAASMSKSNASQKYQGESAPAKGMLLNKKIS